MSYRPPELTRSARAFIRLLDRAAGLSPRLRWMISVLAMLLPPLVELVAPRGVSVGFLYVVGTALAVWTIGEASAFFLVALSVIAGAAGLHIRILVHHYPIGPVGELWNFFARAVMLGLLAIVANGLRGALQLERWRASHDSLTGVMNKRAFEDAAGPLIARARSRKQALVLAYLDLDGFKRINDRHGHSAGDLVLQRFAEAAAGTIRGSDLFARIGGDEFVALMAVPTAGEGDRVAEMLHARLSDVLARSGFPVTCSMGALVAEGDEIDLQKGALELADMLMYEVKRSGKNALRIAHGGAVAIAAPLRTAFPPAPDDELAGLIRQLDGLSSLRTRGSGEDRRVATC